MQRAALTRLAPTQTCNPCILNAWFGASSYLGIDPNTLIMNHYADPEMLAKDLWTTAECGDQKGLHSLRGMGCGDGVIGDSRAAPDTRVVPTEWLTRIEVDDLP